MAETRPVHSGRPVFRMPPGLVAAPVDKWTALLQFAIAAHQAGRLDEAEKAYRKILRKNPSQVDCLHLLGVICHQRGAFGEALRQFDLAAKAKPDAAAVHAHRAATLLALARRDEAVASCDRAIALQPEHTGALNMRAGIMIDARRYPEALADCDRVLAIDPGHAPSHNRRGIALTELRRMEEAVASCDRAIALDPRMVEAYVNRAKALHSLRRFDEVLATCDRAIALKPDLAEAFNNRGNALRGLRRFEEAVESYRRAVALRPDYANAFDNLGIALRDLRRDQEALAAHERSLAIRPDHVDTLCRKGLALAALGRADEAMACYERAVALDPDHAGACFMLGSALLGLQRYEESAAQFARAVALDPDMDLVAGIHLHNRMVLCDWTTFEADSAALKSTDTLARRVIYPFQLLICNSSPAEQLACARTFIANKHPAYPQPLWRGERYRHDRIRLAYVSSDFREHPITHLSAALFERHDRSRFELIAVSTGPESRDPMQERLRRTFDRFLDVEKANDRQVAELMRSLEIDIAVDLNGLTDGLRPNIFAQRPAPVQVNYLGYAGTLGQDYCDYIVADRFVIPEESRQHFAENVVWLPDCFMVTDPGLPIAPTPSRAEAGLPASGFVFCCFNNSYKITPHVFDVWMRLLAAVEGSVLWLSATNAGAVANLRREAAARGVDPDRLTFAPRIASNAEHLARQRLADLFVDTLSYNAHSTAADALWAGLPVLTCAGAAFAGRVAGSLLRAVGLPELITTSVAEYESLALSLARDPARLAALRSKLVRNRGDHPLFDTDRFTRRLERAYAVMAELTRQGEPPRGFAVDPDA